MRKRSIGQVFLLCLIAVPAIMTGAEHISIPEGVEIIVWEHQNWETNGGFERLTLWNDGRSEVVVAPLRYSQDRQENLRAATGWEKVRRASPPRVEFVRRNIYPPDVAREKFKEALAAGIHLLEPFKPGFVDGSGTRIVIQTRGQQKEILIPMFMDSGEGTLNHQRFVAVSEVLGGFDISAYEVVPR